MQIFEDYNLINNNTFHISVSAKYFCEISSETQLLEILKDSKYQELDKLFLGAGSNVLFTKDFPGIVIHLLNTGITVLEETEDLVLIEVKAGENWDKFVAYTIEHNWGGLENLGLIPGNVGSTPIQNIGAYGVEIQDRIEKVIGYQLNPLEKKELTKLDCHFGYRDSIFKREWKNNFVITSVIFKLDKQNHQLKLEYGGIVAELEKLNKPDQYTINDVYQAVCNLRRSKLPDIKLLGSAGSFFKNPQLPVEIYQRIKNTYPDINGFPSTDGLTIKIPAAWLIEKCGWKGRRFGNAGVYDHHSLVIVNYGNASGEEVKNLADQISASVMQQFEIQLESEVNVL